MTPEELRAESLRIQAELRELLGWAIDLYITPGWVKTATEEPTADVWVYGAFFGEVMRCMRHTPSGKWHVDYGHHVTEQNSGPQYWLVLPKIPD